MSRRQRIRRRRASTRLARYALARRALMDRVVATTALGYLRSLDLWPDVEEAPWQDRFDFRFDEPSGDVAGTVAPAEGGPADAVCQTAAISPSLATADAGATSQPGARPPRRPVNSSEMSARAVAGSFDPRLADSNRRAGAAAAVATVPGEADRRTETSAAGPRNDEEVPAGSGVTPEPVFGTVQPPAIESGVDQTVDLPGRVLDRLDEAAGSRILPAPAAAEPLSSVSSAAPGMPPPERMSSRQSDAAAPDDDDPFVGDARVHEETPAPASMIEAVAAGEESEQVARAPLAATDAHAVDVEPETEPESDAPRPVPAAEAAMSRALTSSGLRRDESVPERRRPRVEELRSGSNAAKALGEKGRVTGRPVDVPVASRARRPSAAAVERPAASSEPARPRAADALFLPTDKIDVSPAAWAARLARSLRAGTTAPPASAQPQSTPQEIGDDRARTAPAIPAGVRGAATTGRPAAAGRRDEPVRVSERTRRFLKPLVGVDPSTVAIWQGPRSAALASAYHADGMAVGGQAIVVREAIDQEAPEGLGLLAHELTHVGLHRQPRFVPPIARRLRDGEPVLQDEETMARRVEARIITAARSASGSRQSHAGAATAHASGISIPADPSGQPDRASLDSERSLASPAGAIAPEEQGPMPPSLSSLPAASSDWGGLPAPWEALPAWLASPQRSEPEASPAAPAARPASRASLPFAAAASAGDRTAAGAEAPPPRLADQARTIDPPPAGTGTSAERGKAVAPDLDVMARRVYAVLKRRLESEMRRERMF